MTIRVGDTVRRIGPTTDYFTRGTDYVVTETRGLEVKIGRRWSSTGMFELVRTDWMEHVSYQIIWTHPALGENEVRHNTYATLALAERDIMRPAAGDPQYKILACKKITIPYKDPAA